MGIRFFCQACEKRLNVKGFLAGKRGVCPHCGAKVDIPWESQAERDSAAASPVVAPRSVSPALLPTGPRETQAAVISSAMNGHGYGAAGIASPIHVEPSRPIQPVQTMQPAQPVVASAVPMAAPVAAVAVVAPASPPPAPGPVDPIAEAPNAVWYVRPPSGGQYGPASGEIMRKWIAEGRVSADSLIWREGWPDWKTAASQFPEMAGANASRAAAAPSFPTQPSFGGASEAPASRVVPRRKSNNMLAIVLVVVLTLASLALLVGLVVAIQFGTG